MADITGIQAPQKLAVHHDVESFCSGVNSLDSWLKKRALANEKNNVSRTYVVCESHQVVGYYTLAAGSVQRELAPKKMQRNMPDPIPVMVLGRLAVDQACTRKGIGRGMLRNAIIKTLEATDILGMKAILVHVLSADAKRFYEDFGFTPSAIEPQTLMLTIKEIRASLEPP